MLLSRTQFSLLAAASMLVTSATASESSIAELNPSLLAITISDFEIGESHDFHSAYWAYDAQIETTIAGPEYEGDIRFIVAKASDLKRVFPAQFVLVFQRDRSVLEEEMGTLVEAISMQDAKKIACFRFDLAEVFPGNARFSHKTVEPESPSGYCYKSSDLLAKIDP